MSNNSDYFSEESARAGINTMKKASESQAQNASSFKGKLAEMRNGVFSGTISENFYNSANEHAENLKTESDNTNSLASNSERIKNLFTELVERIKSYRG